MGQLLEVESPRTSQEWLERGLLAVKSVSDYVEEAALQIALGAVQMYQGN